MAELICPEKQAGSFICFSILWQGGFMKDPKAALEIEVEYPSPELTPEQVADLKKGWKMHWCISSEFIKEGDYSIISHPKIRTYTRNPSH